MFDELLDRLARLEQRMATLNPVGKVVQRDHEKGIRVQVGGTDDNPFLSPWIQPGDWAGVGRYLPDVGQQVMIQSHGGDWLQATVLPLTHSDEKKNPAADIDTTVFYQRNNVSMSEKNGVLTRNSKGISETVDGDTTHGAKNIKFTASGGGHLA